MAGLLLDHYPVFRNRLPEGWNLVPIGQEIHDVRSGSSSGKHNEAGLGIPHLRSMNVARTGQISLDQIKYAPADTSELRLRRGDIVFNNTNSREHVGKSAVFNIDEEWGFSNHITRIRTPAHLLADFVAFQLLYLW